MMTARALAMVGWLAALLALASAPAPAAELIGRLKYGGGGDWYANPTSLPNLLAYARRHTSLDLPQREQVVEPGSPEIFDYAFIHATGHGRIRFTDAERGNLRSSSRKPAVCTVRRAPSKTAPWRRCSSSWWTR